MKRWEVRPYGTKYGVFDGDELLYIAATKELADDIIREANGYPAPPGKRCKKVINRLTGQVYWSSKDVARECGKALSTVQNWIVAGVPRNGYDLAYLVFEEEEEYGN